MYLLSTVRSVVIDNPYTKQKMRIPTKIVFGCNPGGIGHKWVKEKYIDPTVVKYDPVTNAPIQTKDYVQIFRDPVTHREVTCNIRFIPASWRDNPFLSEAYLIPLSMQSETKRKMDMDGNWEVVAGKMFDLVPEARLFPNQAIAYLKENKFVKDIYVSIDWGFRPSYHAAEWIMVLEDSSTIAFKEMYGQDLVFEDFVKQIKRESEGFEITGSLLPHDMFRHGDRYRDDEGKVMGETKSEVFEFMGLNPIPVESGKGTVDMRYDKLQSSMVARDEKGNVKHFISNSCEALQDELDNAVYDDSGTGKIDKTCREHAIDAYGLFLVFYSSDIAPIGIEDYHVDTRTKLQIRLDNEEEALYSDGYIDSSDYDL